MKSQTHKLSPMTNKQMIESYCATLISATEGLLPSSFKKTIALTIMADASCNHENARTLLHKHGGDSDAAALEVLNYGSLHSLIKE